jgi:hypothetical protein
MTFGYNNLAHQAAEAERRGHFADAASIWLKAFEVARAVDVVWVQIRPARSGRVGKHSNGTEICALGTESFN